MTNTSKQYWYIAIARMLQCSDVLDYNANQPGQGKSEIGVGSSKEP